MTSVTNRKLRLVIFQILVSKIWMEIVPKLFSEKRSKIISLMKVSMAEGIRQSVGIIGKNNIINIDR